MSVLVDVYSRISVQGFTLKDGSLHSTVVIEYGCNIVGVLTPKNFGQKQFYLPVFFTVADAFLETKANTSIIDGSVDLI